MSLLQSIQTDLKTERAALLLDLEDWRKQSSSTQPENPLMQVRIAIHRVTTALGSATSSLVAPADLDTVETGRGQVQAGAALWEWFRARFAQRHLPAFHRILVLSEDYARALYLAGLEAWKEHVPEGAKEPPFVHLCGTDSPLMISRRDVIDPPGFDPAFRREFADIILDMPVAVVGLPWRQWASLSSLPLLAHEVGHALFEELSLLREAAKKIPGHENWREELASDAIGVALGGAPFVDALARAMAASPDVVNAEPREPDKPHPPRNFRMAWCAAVRQALGLEPGALEKEWAPTFLPLEAMDAADFVRDARLASMREALQLDLDVQGGVAGALQQAPLQFPPDTRPADLVAGLCRVESIDPAKVRAVADRWWASRAQETFGTLVPSGLRGTPLTLKELDALDRKRGDQLFRKFEHLSLKHIHLRSPRAPHIRGGL